MRGEKKKDEKVSQRKYKPLFLSVDRSIYLVSDASGGNSLLFCKENNTPDFEIKVNQEDVPFIIKESYRSSSNQEPRNWMARLNTEEFPEYPEGPYSHRAWANGMHTVESELENLISELGFVQWQRPNEMMFVYEEKDGHKLLESKMGSMEPNGDFFYVAAKIRGKELKLYSSVINQTPVLSDEACKYTFFVNFQNNINRENASEVLWQFIEAAISHANDYMGLKVPSHSVNKRD